ncbi:SURF1 family protein [Flavisphingomonas formosensis]|uniref:SURF1 family protein n=1 Tax=Flavisphingomonas formosensis TaxID=861534 RepID=UPI001E54F36A|nr:SURF1 family protein [Sphingomonas formosensis]
MRRRLIFITLAALLIAAGFVALGVWQLHRLAWKEALIARVEARVHATAVAPPGPAAWPMVDAMRDEYRRVAATGAYLPGEDTLVRAVTDEGRGFWVMTPFDTGGFRIFVNRGFVPDGTPRTAFAAPAGPVRVVGLVRMSEPGGGFLHANDPAADRWYSRDVAAIAAHRRLGAVAPYFVDADRGQGGALPVGGLTVIAFRNSHLQYALTWFALAIMTLGGYIIVMREEHKLRRTRAA